MSEVPHYVLYEHAVGYALMKIKEFEDAGLIIQEVSETSLAFLLIVWLEFKYPCVISGDTN